MQGYKQYKLLLQHPSVSQLKPSLALSLSCEFFIASGEFC